jgi:hypothetical protein
MTQNDRSGTQMEKMYYIYIYVVVPKQIRLKKRKKPVSSLPKHIYTNLTRNEKLHAKNQSTMSNSTTKLEKKTRTGLTIWKITMQFAKLHQNFKS